jgi:hypothetical protein
MHNTNNNADGTYGYQGTSNSAYGAYYFGELDMTLTGTDSVYNAEIDYGRQKQAAWNGGDAVWWGFSMLAHQKWNSDWFGRMGATLRYDYLNDSKNGGGGGGIALGQSNGVDGTNGFGISQACYNNSVANGGNGRLLRRHPSGLDRSLAVLPDRPADPEDGNPSRLGQPRRVPAQRWQLSQEQRYLRGSGGIQLLIGSLHLACNGLLWRPFFMRLLPNGRLAAFHSLYLRKIPCPDAQTGWLPCSADCLIRPARPPPSWCRGYRNFYPFALPSLGSLLYWKLSALWRQAPDHRPEMIPVCCGDAAALRANRQHASVTWLGHASSFIQLAGLNILIDPVLSPRVSPFRHLGPKRQVPAAGSA